MKKRVAAVQMNSQDDKAANIAQAEQLVREAAGQGAEVVVLPEQWTYIGEAEGQFAAAEPDNGPVIHLLQGLAKDLNITIFSGAFWEKVEGRDKLALAMLVIDSKGEIRGKYRKIHLFDANPVGSAAPYKESATVDPGDEIVVVDIDGVRYGLAICYDLRFPELFRLLALRGAQAIVIPAYFTMQTGRDHWEVLLRARAIEDQVYMVAPDQVGRHPQGRFSYGRSMIVDPWGTVIAQAADVPSVVIAEIDLERVEQVRNQVPSLHNRRPEVYKGLDV